MKRIPLILILLVTLAAVASARNDRRDRDMRARRARATYTMLQAMASDATARNADAFYALRAAHEADTTATDIAGLYGQLILSADFDDPEMHARAYRDVSRAFFAAPDRHSADFLFHFAFEDNDSATSIAVRRVMATTYPDDNDLQMAYADEMYRQAGESWLLDSASAIYDMLEQRMGFTPELLARRIYIDMARGDSTAVNRHIMDFLSVAPDDADNLVIAARFYSAVQMNDSAIAVLDRATAVDSTSAEVLFTRAVLLQYAGDTIGYNREVYKILQSPDVEFENKIELLRDFTGSQLGNPEGLSQVSRLFDMMENIHPGEAELHKLHGAYYMAADSMPQAIEQLDYAVSLDHTDPDTYRLLMGAALDCGDTVRAVNVGVGAIPLFPDNLLFTIFTSQILTMQEQYPRALEVLDSFDLSDFNNDKGLSQYFQTRGDVLYQMEMADSAFVSYERALAYDPDNYMCMNNMAYFMACSGIELDRASRLMQTALAFDPGNPTLLDSYAWVLFKLKDYTNARVQIDAALAACNDPSVTGGDKAGDTGKNTGGTDTVATEVVAAESLEETVEPDSSGSDYEISSEMLDHAGDIYFMNGEPTKALDFWKRALEMDPGNALISRKVKYKTYFFDEQ